MNRIFFLLLAAMLASCAVPAKRHNITKNWTTPTEFDKLWANTIEIFGTADIPIGTLEKASGIIVSDWFVLSGNDGAYIDCGTPSALSTAYEKMARLTIMIRDTELGGRKVTVSGQYKQRRVYDRREFYAACFSKGNLEQSISNSILGH